MGIDYPNFDRPIQIDLCGKYSMLDALNQTIDCSNAGFGNACTERQCEGSIEIEGIPH